MRALFHHPFVPIGLIAALALAGCATTPMAPSSETEAAKNAATAVTAAAAGAAAAGAAAAIRATPNAPPGAAVPAAAAAAATAAAAVAGAQRPFAEVVKDAKESKGLFTLWQKDDKVWMEIEPDQLDKMYFFAANLSSGIGENWLFGGLMGDSDIVSFHKTGTTVQLLARNQRYFAAPGTPEARAIAEAFSDSLVATAPIASQPHPDRKSVLIEVNTLLFSDIPGFNGHLDRVYRQPYSFDSRNTSITRTRVTPEQTSINISAHYALSRVIQPPMVPGPIPMPALPSSIPDVRSMFLGINYNFTKLPDQPMAPRVADARVGYFFTSRYDYSNDNPLTPRINYVNRWRLEKKDPAAAMSEPKQPIVFWVDRNIPVKYRPTVVAGILEWNKAFERIGFQNAIEAKIQPEDADFDTFDTRHASVRWMPTARPMFGGVGPVQVDPRSGEILDADVGIDPVRIRNRRSQYVEQVAASPLAPPSFGRRAAYLCERATLAEQEVGFALDLLDARGDIAPGSAQEEEFALDDLRETVMHEIGHVLGLTHNFRASTIYTRAQLNDVTFTKKYGISGSVMEYNPINLALKDEHQGSYSMNTLGPYDYWAIEYGYKTLSAETEAAELKKLAARSTEPQLAYAYDNESSSGIDPEAATLDLSNDPLDFAQRRLALAHELWDRWQARKLTDGDNLTVLRRNLTRGLIAVRDASLHAARYIGGISVLRDAAGSGRTPLNPVAPDKQREALKLIETGVFAADSFRFKPEFLRRLSVDWLDRNDAFDTGIAPPSFDYSVPNQVLAVQRVVLNQLMSDGVAQRLLDSEAKVDNPRQALRVTEVYASLHRSIWSELRTGEDIPLLRRNLQREHATRLAGALLRPASSMPADARALLRADARQLRTELAAAQNRATWSPEAKAHLAEALATIDEALKAPLVRQAV